MQFGIEPFLPTGYLWPAFLLAALLLTWTVWRFQGLVSPRFLATLAGLRLLSLAALLLLILNPFLDQSRPDPDGFRVVLLGDASGSMETRDVAGGEKTRAEQLARWMESRSDSPLQPLREQNYFLEPRIFSETARPMPSGDWESLPGLTAIGDVLHAELDRSAEDLPPIGAVVLLSDGHSNTGASPTEAARRYRDRGIPISTVGIGHSEEEGELEIRFRQPRYRITRGESLTLTTVARNPGSGEPSLEVTFHEDRETLHTEEITLAAGAEKQIRLPVNPWRAPFQVYRLEAHFPDDPEREPIIDYSIVEIQDRDTFRLLYLGGALSMEHRFLRRAVAEADTLSMEAIIRTGEEHYFQALEESIAAYFPEDEETLASPIPREQSFFFSFDSILVDTRLLFDLPGETLEALIAFTDQRGGGLLFMGPMEAVPTPLERIMPAIATEKIFTSRQTPLHIEPAPVFQRLDGSVLFRQPAPFVPQETTTHWVTDWKRGARPVIKDSREERALLLAQAYGAGRVAYLGTESTWRWRMDSDTGWQQHQQFWENFLVWLSSQGKPRVRVPPHGMRFPLHQEMDLAVEVLGSDFRPAREGDVSVRVDFPDGDTEILPLSPSFAQPGRFSTAFYPEQIGEYRLRFRIDLPDGEELNQEAYFLGAALGREMEEVSYREDVLRDIARISGGLFREGSSRQPWREIPLTQNVPTTEERRYLALNFWLFLLLFLPLLYEWYLRRSHGLK